MSTSPADLRLIGPTALAKRLGKSIMTIHRWEKAGLLPARFSIGPRTLRVWRLADVEALLAKRAAKGSP